MIPSAQPVHKLTGQRGPICPFATFAALWIIRQPDMSDWRWELVHTPAPEISVS